MMTTTTMETGTAMAMATAKVIGTAKATVVHSMQQQQQPQHTTIN
jgi:hypothetical protein